MSLDFQVLQTLVSSICSDAIVSISRRTEVVVELDDHGRNLAATWTTCPTCNGDGLLHTTPLAQPDVRLKVWCPTCDGVGHVIESEPTRQIDVLAVKLGRVEMSTDAPATQAEAEKLVRDWTVVLAEGRH